jgi:Zn-dependent peptidase ImmA (M78 family)
MHELGHIVLGDSTIHSDEPFHAYVSPEEVWCNRFAAAVLVPREALVGLDITNRFGEQGLWGEQDVRELARIFKVSPSVMVRRLDRFNLIHTEVASYLRMTFDDYTPEPKEKSEGGPTYYIRELASWGYYVPDILFQSYREGVSGLAELTMALRASSPTMVERYEAQLLKRNLSAVP